MILKGLGFFFPLFSLSAAENRHDNPNFPINHRGSDSFKPFTSEEQQGVIFSAAPQQSLAMQRCFSEARHLCCNPKIGHPKIGR